MKGKDEPRKDWISGDSWQLIKWAQIIRADLRVSRANISGMRVAVAFNAWKWTVADDGTADEWVGAVRTSWLMVCAQAADQDRLHSKSIGCWSHFEVLVAPCRCGVRQNGITVVSVLVVQTWNCECHSSCYVCGPLPNASSGTCVRRLPSKNMASGNSTRLHTKQQFNDLHVAFLPDAYFSR